MDAPLITPDNAESLLGAGHSYINFGGHVRWLNANDHPMGSSGAMMATPIEDVLELIPEEQWPDLISQKDREKSWAVDLCDGLDIPCKDQDGLGFCHAYGPVTDLEVNYAQIHGRKIVLSAESVGGYVTGWRNQGADPEEDLRVMMRYGVAEESFMDKPNSLQPDRWKTGWQENALTHRVVEAWMGLSTNLWQVAGTLALRSMVASTWFNWWSHCISDCYRLRYNAQTKQVERLARNNWGMSFGDRGYLWMAKGTGRGGGTPSGILAVRFPTVSGT